ncbi:MAG: ThiF family adenylyltransferase [Promethearchaeota archaeon]|nr:MAG: ThiF family adenylyltransferase [Candidatus Lokiarchaeota archaeon]
MFNNKKSITWKKSYRDHISRNIGLISALEQEKLRNASVAIFGMGGLGGPLAEQLVRAGFEHLIICDNDKFESTNLNRQICSLNDLGKFKIEAIEELLLKINPDTKIQKYYEIDEKNISEILHNVSIVALTLDDVIASLIISRESRKKEIPMIETWGIPYLWAWWFTSDNADFETCYNLKTQNLTIGEIKRSDLYSKEIRKAIINKLLKFKDLKEKYDREKGYFDRMIEGSIPLISIAPIVRLNASYLAFEIIFSGVLKIKEMIKAPNIIGYDYFSMKPINKSL